MLHAIPHHFYHFGSVWVFLDVRDATFAMLQSRCERNGIAVSVQEPLPRLPKSGTKLLLRSLNHADCVSVFLER